MFQDTSTRLVSWINQVAGESIATLGHLAPSAGGHRVGLSLLDVRPHASRPGAKVDVTLRYLVTVSASVATDAHRLLGQLTFAAMTHREFQVDRDPLPIEFWLAHALPPQPSLVVGVLVSRDRRNVDGHAAPRLLSRAADEFDASRSFDRRVHVAGSTSPLLQRRASDARRHATAPVLSYS